MKQIKVSPVVYEMLQALSKKRKIKLDSLIDIIIKDVYAKTFH